MIARYRALIPPFGDLTCAVFATSRRISPIHSHQSTTNARSSDVAAAVRPLAPPKGQSRFSKFLRIRHFRSSSSLAKKLILLATLTTSTAFCLGCGGGDARRHRVWGKVSYDGTPVERGQISLHPEDGNHGPLAGGQIENGHYDVRKEDGPFAGPHRVELLAIHKTGRKIHNMGGELIDHEENFLPDKYSSENSELRVEISSSGKNEHNFPLEK